MSAGGRWNRRDVYGCLYTSMTRRGAIAEFEKASRVSALINFQRWNRDLVSILVELEPVEDLANRKPSPISLDEPFLTGDDPNNYEACWSLADLLGTEGYIALISPSSAQQGKKNLHIYIDGLAGNIKLRDGGDRIPI
ncbi:MAG: RES family NAD+ phosphorylase [Anaerolineales bacterium]